MLGIASKTWKIIADTSTNTAAEKVLATPILGMLTEPEIFGSLFISADLGNKNSWNES